MIFLFLHFKPLNGASICLVQVHVVTKTNRGNLRLYSNETKNTRKKTAWGDIRSISFTQDRNRKGVMCDYFSISSGEESLLFKTEQFSPTLGEVTPLSKAMVQVILEKGYSGVPEYISLLLQGDDGEEVGRCAPENLNVMSADEFKNLATESALIIKDNDRSKTLESFGKGVESNFQTDSPKEKDAKKPRKSKSEIAEDEYIEALNDEIGIEEAYMRSIIGRREIPIWNLSVAPDHPVSIDSNKVLKLKKSIEDRIDHTSVLDVGA